VGIVKLIAGFAAAVLIGVFGVHAFLKARRLNTRILDYKREQEQRKNAGTPANPYAELAEIYAEKSSTAQSEKKRGKS